MGCRYGEDVWNGIPFAKIDHPKPTPEGVIGYPGVLGGENYAPEAYDPATNYVLIPGIEQPSLFKAAKTEEEAGTPDFPGAAAFGTMIEEVPDVKGYGTITAIDVDTGKQAYQIKTTDPQRGGLTSTESGLAFFGELDGKVNAMDIKAGKVIWTFQTSGDNVQSAPSIFRVDGKSYVVFTTGGRSPKCTCSGLAEIRRKDRQAKQKPAERMRRNNRENSR